MATRDRASVDAVIKAYDVRGVVGDGIDEEFVRDVGASFAHILRGEDETTVAVGHDMRDSSPTLATAFADGVRSQGLNVIYVGLVSTDELYFASGRLNCAGAMFTASHNPAKYNGIKMCRSGARPVGEATGLDRIKDFLVDGVPSFDGDEGSYREQDVLEDYATFLKELVNLENIRPLVVAVDAGNGMGGFTVPAVLKDLPLDIRPLYFELDGNFPNHEANPLEPKNIVYLQRYVKDQHADIGLAFDGDADRCFVVDEKGDPVTPSAICAIVAKRYLDKKPGSTVIHNLITSRSVPEVIAENGGTAVRTRVGHSFIKATMAEENAIFGGEHSAHYYFAEFFNADSGLLAALHVLAALGGQDKPLSELMAEYNRYSASGEINSRLDSAEEQKARMVAVKEAFADRAESIDELDGVTVDLGDGRWFNVRASNTEPLLRLNAEAPSDEAVSQLADEVLAVIRG